MPDPNNPYRLVDVDDYDPSPYHPRAIGLQGEMLDAMLKAAFTEGVVVGAQEARDAFDDERIEIQDRAYDIGRDAGVAMVRGRLVEARGRASSSFQRLQETIEASQMSAQKKSWLIDTHLRVIEDVIGAVVREFGG